MPIVEIINMGTIPPRTKVEIIGGIPIPTKDTVVDASKLAKEYECIDCAFKTQDVAKMAEHQSGNSHSIWQRFMRWWNS